MVAGQLTRTKSISTVQAQLIIAPKQISVSQGNFAMRDHFAITGDNGAELQSALYAVAIVATQ